MTIPWLSSWPVSASRGAYGAAGAEGAVRRVSGYLVPYLLLPQVDHCLLWHGVQVEREGILKFPMVSYLFTKKKTSKMKTVYPNRSEKAPGSYVDSIK